MFLPVLRLIGWHWYQNDGIEVAHVLGCLKFGFCQVYINGMYLIDCSAWCCATICYYCHPSFSVCEQAEKLAVLDHTFSVTSMIASMCQLLC